MGEHGVRIIGLAGRFAEILREFNKADTAVDGWRRRKLDPEDEMELRIIEDARKSWILNFWLEDGFFHRF